MATLAIHSDVQLVSLAKPNPRPRNGPISIRAAVPGASDLKIIDGLMKKHSKMVGFMPTKQLAAHIEAGHVLIAEEKVNKSTNQQVEMGEAPALRPDGSDVDLSTCRPPGVDFAAQPLGYVLHMDKYFKRDDCGIIYQLNVAPGRQRGLIGAALIKAAFEQAASSCKLYCCWCAQDLEANHFWESIGFVPLAFRAGSRPRMKQSGAISKEGRVHIFWQRRIREGDEGPASGGTSWWFPSETKGGALREARIVLPIPPGTHWSDAMPMVLPGQGSEVGDQKSEVGDQKGALTSDLCPLTSGKKPRGAEARSKAAKVAKASPGIVKANGIRTGPLVDPKAAQAKSQREKRPRPRGPRGPRMKNDPKYVAAARELCDRYLEEVNSGRMLPASWGGGKYDVSRQLAPAPGAVPTELKPMPPRNLLEAA